MGFIGHTRFSLLNPDSPNWLASNGSRFKTAAEYREYLYSEERLDVRCDVFLNISLPQLQLASAGFDYRHVVSYSDTLPVKYQKLLEQAERDFDFLVLDRHSVGGSTRSLLEVAREMYGADSLTDTPGQPFGWFRLDDDDLLSVDYFRQASAYITPANIGMQVSFGTGVTALLEEGLFYNARISYSPLNSMGLMNICRFDTDGTLVRPRDASHNRSDRSNAVILDSRLISYLWVRHPSQDTALNGPQLSAADQSARTLQDMSRFPRVQSIDELSSAFPLLLDRFSGSPSPELALVARNPAPLILDENGIRIETGSASGVVHIELTLDCGTGAAAGNALIGLILVDSDGTPIGSDVMREELSTQGLLHSPVPGIGHFRYVNVRPGQEDYSMTFNLPTGVHCSSVLVRRWNNPELSVRVVCFDVFGSAKHEKDKMKAAKVFVYGSCVSRDPFELATKLQLVDYRSRSSLGSAFASLPLNWQSQLNLDAVVSPFQRRMVTADVTKTLADDLREADFDALVLDFIDERMSTVEIGGSVVTDSPELEATGFVADLERKREPWTDDGWRLRKAGIAALLDVVHPSRIIVNRAFWATKDNAGQEFAQAAWITKNNVFLRDLYSIFEGVPEVRFIDYPEQLMVADSRHRWGRQPYHFVPAFSAHCVRELECLLEAD